MSDSAAKYLIDTVKTHRELFYLEIPSRKYTSKVVKLSLDVLKVNPTLKKLDLLHPDQKSELKEPYIKHQLDPKLMAELDSSFEPKQKFHRRLKGQEYFKSITRDSLWIYWCCRHILPKDVSKLIVSKDLRWDQFYGLMNPLYKCIDWDAPDELA
jgi:hypothetical protein